MKIVICNFLFHLHSLFVWERGEKERGGQERERRGKGERRRGKIERDGRNGRKRFGNGENEKKKW